MYLIYNETGKALKLNVAQLEDTAAFQVGLADDNGNFNEFHTITTIADKAYADAVSLFCNNCTNITNSTSRFFFRHPEKKMVYYNTTTCEAVAVVKPDREDKSEEAKATAKQPRNCIILVLHKNSIMKVQYTAMAGHVPAKVIDLGDYKILITFARANNWVMMKSQVCMYIDGANGKKQIRMGYVKTGPNKEYTSNNLFEEDFEGDEFPAEVTKKPDPAKKNNYSRETRTDRNGAQRQVFSNSLSNGNNNSFNNNGRGNNKRGNGYGKKNYNRGNKLDRYN